MKLDIPAMFEGDDGGNADDEELARHDEDAKQCVQVYEVLAEDFVEAPVLSDGRKYKGFIDTGYNVTTIVQDTGEETLQTVEGCALIEEYMGRITFQELQIKTVQKNL